MAWGPILAKSPLSLLPLAAMNPRNGLHRYFSSLLHRMSHHDMMLKAALQSMFKMKHECKEALSTYAPCNNYPRKPTCQKKTKNWKETHQTAHILLSEGKLYGQYIFSCFQFAGNGVIWISSKEDKPIIWTNSKNIVIHKSKLQRRQWGRSSN